MIFKTLIEQGYGKASLDLACHFLCACKWTKYMTFPKEIQISFTDYRIDTIENKGNHSDTKGFPGGAEG